MMYRATKRISDGILTWGDEVPTLGDEATEQTNAVIMFGGVPSDYELIELTPEQFAALRAAMPARSKLVGGVLTSATPITTGLSAATVEADGVATITLSVDTHDASYGGAVTVNVTPPDGGAASATLTASAGLASTTISTNQVGVHQVAVETVLHGLAFTSFEGV
jgi:hypothetical protein